MNPDCEQDETYIQADHAEGDSAEASSTSKKRTGKKKDYSKTNKSRETALCTHRLVQDLKGICYNTKAKQN